MNSKIAVVGNVNLDINATITESKNTQEERINSLLLSIGGTAANTAVGLAKLNDEATLFANLGDDCFADILIDKLSAEGVITDEIARLSNGQTGICFVSRGIGGERHLKTFRGVNETPIIGTCDGFVHFAGVSPAQISDWFNHNNPTGTSYAPGGIVTFERPQEVSLISAGLDFLFLNETEYSFLKKNGDSKARATIVTLGEKGATLIDTGLTVKAFDIEQVDSTGAGDAFNAGFLHAYLKDRPMLECLSFANAIGALAVSKPGACGVFTVNDVERFLLNFSPELVHILK